MTEDLAMTLTVRRDATYDYWLAPHVSREGAILILRDVAERLEAGDDIVNPL